MTAAIYARKSTDQTGVPEDERSVARQIEHGKAYALEKGWTVPDDLIFVDDGISGAEFIKRPGFIRLMNALKPKPSFSFLVMSEESRLGRESIETSYALKQITDANVRVFFYLEDRERTLDNAMDKLLLSLSSFASEMERERGKQRTHDALRRKAKAGHVTGGKTFGYDNREVLSTTGQRLHVLRVINPNEAAIVRQIFEMFAGGMGIGRIAKRLNEDSTPAPRLSPRGWAPSAVRAILLRPLYKGEIVWNQHEKFIRGGTKKRRERDENEWVRLDAPDMRIIPHELWEKVNSRFTKNKGKGRSSNRDQESKYLLTGMARCAHCGGPMTIVGKSYSRKSGRYYGCSYYKSRGSSICKNSLLVEQDVLDQIVLKSIQDVLTEKMLNAAIEKALAQHRAGDQAKVGRRIAVQRELSLIEAQLERLVDAVANGQKDRALFNRITAEEAKKDALIAELEQLGKAHMVPHLDDARLKRELKSRLADIRDMLTRHINYGRRLLRVLMESPLKCESIGVGDRKEYRITGTGSYLRLLADSGCSVVNGVPNGIFQRGSRSLVLWN